MKHIFRTVALVAFVAALTAGTASAEAGKKGATPDKISHGEKVEIKDYLVPGKITIFDFMSQYCPPCRQVAPLLEELHARRDDVAVVKIDINRPDVKGIDWKSPVARQYELESIPHFKVYGADGKLMAEGDAAAEMVFGWLEQK